MDDHINLVGNQTEMRPQPLTVELVRDPWGPEHPGYRLAALFSHDYGGTAELFAFDEVGNVTQLSPPRQTEGDFA